MDAKASMESNIQKIRSSNNLKIVKGMMVTEQEIDKIRTGIEDT